MRRFLILFVSGLALVRPVALMANTWCSINYPTAVFCDDFDRYCSNPPPAPQECTSGGDFNALRQVWEWTNVVCSNMTIDDTNFASSPFAGRTPCQAGGLLTHHGVELAPYCQAAFGASEYQSILGNDAHPLILEFILHGQNNGKVSYANSFMELGHGSAKAATDYILSPNCSSCGGASDQYEIVCQQNNPPAGCPPLATAPHVTSIAAGALAYLDGDPCHCSGSEHSPSNSHLSFFDGFKWWILRQGLFPGGGSGGGGDFLLRNGQNQVRLTVTSTSVKVELNCIDLNPDQYSWCDVPRDYLGQFSRLYAGVRVPCKLQAGTWNCTGAGYACIKGAPNGGVPTYDNVVLRGGQGYTTPGACCYPDTSCALTYGANDCVPSGGQYQGNGVQCANVACCPPFQPDHDLDGDVDVSDFGWFQRCLPDTGSAPPNLPCTCADLNNDNRVNQDDLAIFVSCVNGADLPADPGCVN